jgi:AraC-like DNA-binding protein
MTDLPQFAPLHLTTAIEAPHRRIELAREVFGRQVLRLDVEPERGAEFSVDLKLRSLPGLKLVSGRVTGLTTPRTKSLLSDGNDDLFLSMSITGRLIAEQRNHVVDIGRDTAHLASNAERMSYVHIDSRATACLAPRKAIAELVSNIDDRIGKPLPPRPHGVRLLRDYATALSTAPASSTPGLSETAVTHVYDLIALIIGVDRDAEELVVGRGLKAARLQAIKTHVVRHLAGGDLSVGAVATDQRLTPRYVQRLFETDGTTFSAYVLEQRLRRAHDLLSAPARSGHTISTIAYECGFRDVSHFNHMFRRRYGATPSDIRALAEAQAG